MQDGVTTCRASEADSSMVLRARIIDAGGWPIRPEDVRRIDCTVRELEPCDRGIHECAVEQTDVLLPALVRDSSWTIDDVGYNFRHDIAQVAPFAEPRCNARVKATYVFNLAKGGRATVSFCLRLG